MARNTETILREVLSLPEEMRAYIAEILIESLDRSEFPLSDEWLSEIERRCEEIDCGNVVLKDADTVFREIRTKLK